MPRAHRTSWYREHPLLPFGELAGRTAPCQLCGRDFNTKGSNRSLCQNCVCHSKRLNKFWNARRSARMYIDRYVPVVHTEIDKLHVSKLSAIAFAYVVFEEDLFILKQVAERIRPNAKIGAAEIDNFLAALKESKVDQAAEKLLHCAIEYQRSARNIDEMFKIDEGIPADTTFDLWYEDLDDEMEKYLARLFSK